MNFKFLKSFPTIYSIVITALLIIGCQTTKGCDGGGFKFDDKGTVNRQPLAGVDNSLKNLNHNNGSTKELAQGISDKSLELGQSLVTTNPSAVPPLADINRKSNAIVANTEKDKSELDNVKFLLGQQVENIKKLEKDNTDQKKTIEDQKTEIAKLNDMLSSWMRMVVGAGVPIGGLLMAIALPVCIWINKTLGAVSAVLGVCMLVMSLAILKFYNDFAVVGGIIVLFILVGGIGFAIWSAKSHADIKDAFEETRDHIEQDIKPTLSSEQFEKIYGRSGSYISQMSSKSYDLIKKLEKKI